MGVRRAGSGGLSAPGAASDCGPLAGVSTSLKALDPFTVSAIATALAPVTHVGGYVVLAWLRGECSPQGVARGQAEDGLHFLDAWKQNRRQAADVLRAFPAVGPAVVAALDGADRYGRPMLEQIAGVSRAGSSADDAKERAKAAAFCDAKDRANTRLGRPQMTTAQREACIADRLGNLKAPPQRNSRTPAPAPAPPSSGGDELALGLGALLLLEVFA